VVVPTRIKHEEAGNPLWMFTMGDMSNLLLIFFILLFALMSMDKSRFAKLQDDLSRAGAAGKEGAVAAGPGDPGAAALRSMLEQPAAEPKVLQGEGHYAQVRLLPEGTALTIGGEEGGFREGDWRLTAVQKKLLVELKKWMAGRKNVIEVRGHASANLQDSAVLEPEGRIRPFSPADLERPDRHAAADHSLLSWLRAREVVKFLGAAHPDLGDTVRIEETRVRARADGYTRAVADSADPVLRVRNRRIEVVATSEQVEK
jgi:flagellar motor protein MotB